MKKYLITSLLFSFPIFAQDSLWVGFDYGRLSIGDSAIERTNERNYMGSKLFLSREITNWIFDAGLGFAEHSFTKDYISGPYLSGEFSSAFGYLYLAPRYKINESWSIGLENNIAVINRIKTGINQYQDVFTGVGVNYHKDLSNNLEARLGVSLQQGMNFDENAQLLTMSLQIGFKADKKTEAIIHETVRPTPQDRSEVGAQFGVYGFEISKDQKQSLDYMITLVKENEVQEIVIEGHADESGDYKINEPLSLKRAQSVADYFQSMNIASEKIRIEGKGAWEPLIQENSPEAKALNRRVVIKIYFKR